MKPVNLFSKLFFNRRLKSREEIVNRELNNFNEKFTCFAMPWVFPEIEGSYDVKAEYVFSPYRRAGELMAWFGGHAPQQKYRVSAYQNRKLNKQ